MNVPTIKVKFRDGSLVGVVTINRADFNQALHETHDPVRVQAVVRFLAVIKGAGYSDVAAEHIFNEYFEKYFTGPHEAFETMLAEYEKEQAAQKLRDTAALAEDTGKTVSEFTDEELTKAAIAAAPVAPEASVIPKPAGKLRVGQSSSRG